LASNAGGKPHCDFAFLSLAAINKTEQGSLCYVFFIQLKKPPLKGAVAKETTALNYAFCATAVLSVIEVAPPQLRTSALHLQQNSMV